MQTNTAPLENFDAKINEFSLAMEKYNQLSRYVYTCRVVSMMIVLLQAITLFQLLRTNQTITFLGVTIALLSAYVITDFINGLVHMYMDNNTRYSSRVGPFIAAFHLHHSKPRYQPQHPFKIYFYESGTKFWLLIYLCILACSQYRWQLPISLNIALVSIGILSSIAELSHYWCHNATKKNKLIRQLQTYHILLSKRHHATHHLVDNKQYAFLNGMTDPLLNVISKYCYAGYKNNADKHVGAYMKLSKKA